VNTSTAGGGGTFTTTSGGGAPAGSTGPADPPYVTVNYSLYTGAAYVPDAGMLAPYAGPVAPDGWLLADGRCLATAGRYAKLFNAARSTTSTPASSRATGPRSRSRRTRTPGPSRATPTRSGPSRPSSPARAAPSRTCTAGATPRARRAASS
jgi:hypothetical protein